MSRRTLINLVFFNLVFLGFIVWAVGNIVSLDVIERPYEIRGEFAAAAGVLPDAEVSYQGVRFGRVSAVDRTPGGVEITMKIDRGKEIPADSRANIFRKSAVGEPYILFSPPDGYDGEGPFLQAGDVIPVAQTTVPLEFSEMLRSASRLIGSIDPHDAGVLVDELAKALAGRSDDLRELTLAGDQLAQTFAERTDVLDRLATNNTRLTKVFAEHGRDLSNTIGDLRALAASLRNAQGNLDQLLGEGSQLLGRTANIVSSEKQNLDCMLGDLEDVLDLATTDARITGLETVLQVGPRAFAAVFDTRDIEPDGVWVRVGLIVNTVEEGPIQWVPAKDLPAVPKVPACVSDLTAAPGSFTPEAPRGDLAATGRDLGLAMLLAIAGAAIVLANVSHRRVP